MILPADFRIHRLLFSENAIFPRQNIAIPPSFVGHFALQHNQPCQRIPTSETVKLATWIHRKIGKI